MRFWLDKLYTRLFFRDLWFTLGCLASLLANLIIWLWIYNERQVFLQSSSEFAALHYKVFFGIDFLSAWYYIFILPGTGLAFLLLNYFLARASYRHNAVIVYALTVTSLATQFLLWWAVVLVLAMNLY